MRIWGNSVRMWGESERVRVKSGSAASAQPVLCEDVRWGDRKSESEVGQRVRGRG